jgi:8-oxo-dGTP pyrophosphatase MutT (NUDIX family)
MSIRQSCGASVIIYRDNKVLLQQRKDNKCWGYVGGYIEMGEIVEEAAKREMYEESGLTALSLDLFGVFSGPELYHVYPDGNKVHIIDIVFICNEFVGNLKPQESEVLKLQWFDFDKVPENLSNPIKPALHKFLEKQLQYN